jgi:uncharacterized hydrophobic protein (TIGR00271 family)
MRIDPLKLLRSVTNALFTSFRISDEDRRVTISDIESGASGSREYYVFIVLSCIIAALGLIQNSAAVIIGAMVVAPLMSPVLGVSMAIVLGEFSLLSRSFKSVGTGVLIAIAMSFLMAKTVHVDPQTPEILARTQPNLLDLIIGLAAGGAGAFALSRKSLVLSLSGVAIAVSLMPPLAVTGIGIALGNGEMAYKSFLLCFSNMVAINMAAILVFSACGFISKESDRRRKDFTRHLGISVILLLLLSLPLGYFLKLTISQSIMDRIIRTTVRKMVDRYFEGLITTGRPGDRSPAMRVGGVLPEDLGREGKLQSIQWTITGSEGAKHGTGSRKGRTMLRSNEKLIVLVDINSNYRTMDDESVTMMWKELYSALGLDPGDLVLDIRIYQSSYEVIKTEKQTEIRDRPTRIVKPSGNP